MKNTKHILFAIIATVMLGLASVNSAQAQIVLLGSDQNSNRSTTDGSLDLPGMPDHNSTYDYYEFTPLGGSVWVLSALGLAYLAGKRKKEE